MFLQSLQLHDFRNYAELALDLSSAKTILVGDNAQGKSNLLEAVQLLATGRSSRALRDRELVTQGKEQSRVAARIERLGGTVELELILRAGKRRTVRLGGETQRTQAEALGYLNCVSFSSIDLDLVRGAPETRRDWLDGILLQLEPIYTSLLAQYLQVLHQRNALLRRTDLSSEALAEQLPLWDDLLTRHATPVMRRRHRLLLRLAPLAQHWHRAISGGRENFAIHYQPQIAFEREDAQSVQQALTELLAQKQALEVRRGTSLVGPHRDEVELTIDGIPARQFGSQGQQRTLVLALKLAELNLLEQVTGEVPLLLLDDVLAELDLHRQDQLLGAIGERVQTIVTTTHLGLFDSQWLHSATVLTIKQGQVHPDGA
ncbi:DNA replication/repair protein RecF [Gloeobacter kilaueensis]|uniref:DNA replication and repair protein RecF n=1 Tax=Gloeobacter kilaueensis (strain ATCC BAA-2537 / CCAP 1431/1 / ULC 316 / JS1) TaxID=1183438 RepID=U5QFY8_GLOK1|nr:DNA replication/repair protein RecF [Gloeobacter kilaueensis]AGY57821.1 recombination protein F [Gloeobacter kilaueensis JS1]